MKRDNIASRLTDVLRLKKFFNLALWGPCLPIPRQVPSYLRAVVTIILRLSNTHASYRTGMTATGVDDERMTATSSINMANLRCEYR